MASKHTLKGYDTFSSEYYSLGGEFATYPQALAAAHKELQDLEAQQPSAQSGGQDGIQDRVYIVHPNGQYERVR